MRPTLTLDDDVLEAARRRAREPDRPLKDVVTQARRRGLALATAAPAPAFGFRLGTVEGRLLAGVDLEDRHTLCEAMERESPVVALDTSRLVHAHRRGTAHHDQAVEPLRRPAEGPVPSARLWPCRCESVRVVRTAGSAIRRRRRSGRWRPCGT